MKRTEAVLLIAFVDLSRFEKCSALVTDSETADVLQQFYDRVSGAVQAGLGLVVKFIGDGALIVFEEGDIDRGVQTLIGLKPTVDTMMQRRGWDCTLNVKAHVGSVVTGEFGASGNMRFDVIGKAVNDAARLPGEGIVLSRAAFDRVGSALKDRFNAAGDAFSYR